MRRLRAKLPWHEEQTSPTPSFPDGIKVLYDCPDAIVDICFVHGLSGNRESTWKTQGQSIPWPGAFLPLFLGQARIFTYGYDAHIARRGSVASTNGLSEHAKNLLTDLTVDRGSALASRPLIFVAHSLGGLICKEAILLSRNNAEQHLRSIFDSTKGIMFMGTPHRGSLMADWGGIASSALGTVKSANKLLWEVLETDNQYLHSVQDRFSSMVRERRGTGRGLEVACFFEELPSPRVGVLVSRESATLEGYNAIGIHANHGGMAKFVSPDDNGFKRVLGELVRWQSQIRDASERDAVVENPVDRPSERQRSGDQFNAPGGTQIISQGGGNHFPGATFFGSVYFGSNEPRG